MCATHLHEYWRFSFPRKLLNIESACNFIERHRAREVRLACEDEQGELGALLFSAHPVQLVLGGPEAVPRARVDRKDECVPLAVGYGGEGRSGEKDLHEV